MSVILLGIEPNSKSAAQLAEELAKFGFDAQLAFSGYEVIRKALEMKPGAIILENGIQDCDILKTAVWLKKDSRTSLIPQFLIQKPKADGDPKRERLKSLADKVCNFVESFPPGKSIADIAKAIKENEESLGLRPSPEVSPPADVPTKAAILNDLAEAFEERFVTSRLMLRLFRVSKNIEEVDYFTKSLLMQVATIFDCEIVSFIWKSTYVTEYNLISSPVDMGLFEALRRRNQQLLVDARWGVESLKDLITWGRKHLYSENGDVDDDVFDSKCVSVDIRFRNVLRGRLTLASSKADPEYWDREVLENFHNQLTLIFSNFIMYHDLETKLSRDGRIFQSINELAGISNLTLGGLRSYLMQVLLILLDLCGTTSGAIILCDDEGNPEEISSIGESDELFLSLNSDGKSVIEIALEGTATHIFGEGIVGDEKTLSLDSYDMKNLVAVPLQCWDSLNGVILLGNIEPIYSVKEIKFLGIFAKQISNQIFSYKTYSSEHLERQSLEDQLNVARDIQVGLLPKGEMQHKGFDFYGRSDPAKEVGGDFFDYYPLSKDWIGVTVADVSGKGMPAALLMSAAMTTFRSIFEDDCEPEIFLSKVNSILAKEFFSDKFLTALIGVFAPGRLKVASGGHHPALVYRVSEDRFEYIDPDGIALGILDDADFEGIEVKFEPGDIIVFFTDGLCEAKNRLNEQFGYPGIESVIRANTDACAKEIVGALFKAAEEHAQGMPAYDDTTIVVAVAQEVTEEDTYDASKGIECVFT